MDQKVTIDEKEYSVDALSDEAKSHLNSVQLADQKIAQLRTEIAMIQTARNTYAEALKTSLPTE